MKTSNKLKKWANYWYKYTFNEPEAKHHSEMYELKAIIKEVRKLEKGK